MELLRGTHPMAQPTEGTDAGCPTGQGQGYSPVISWGSVRHPSLDTWGMGKIARPRGQGRPMWHTGDSCVHQGLTGLSRNSLQNRNMRAHPTQMKKDRKEGGKEETEVSLTSACRPQIQPRPVVGPWAGHRSPGSPGKATAGRRAHGRWGWGEADSSGSGTKSPGFRRWPCHFGAV